MSDYEQLIAKAAAGDTVAFEEIYRRTCKKVYFTCMSFLKNEQDAADVSQEVYIIVMRSLPTLKEPSSFESWIGRITVNRCKNFLKKNRPVPVDDETLTGLIDGENSEFSGELMLPEEYVTNEAKRKIIMDILKDNLSDILYQTVVLFYFHDMSAAEIAQMMDCPVGTVTSRLCIARAKIKEGVQNYEKKNGDKLYSVALVPVLAAILMAEANAMEPVSVCANVLSATSNIINTAGMAAEQTASSVGGTGTASQVGTAASASAGTAKVVTLGGKAMLRTLKAKIIASILALVVIGGGIIAAVVISNNSEDEKPEKKVESTQEDKRDNSGKEQDKNSDGGSSDNNNDSGNNDSDNWDYYVQVATDVVNGLEEYVDALKSGDMEVLLKYTNPESHDGKFLQAISEYSWAGELIAATCVNFEWYYREDEVYFLANSLSRNEGEETELFYCHQIQVTSSLLKATYICQHDEGTIVPAEIEFENSEEALEVFKGVIAEVPKHYGTGVNVTVPDENGDFYIDFELFEFINFDAEDVEEDGEMWLIEYVDWYCTGLGTDMYVGETDYEFKEYNEEINVMHSYLQSKDFEGWIEWLKQNMGLDYDVKYGESNGTYEDLSESQKEWVDNFIENEMTYTYHAYSRVTDVSDIDPKEGVFVITYPHLDAGEKITEWTIENDCVDIACIYPSWFYVDENGSSIDSFMFLYYDLIGYALEYIK